MAAQDLQPISICVHNEHLESKNFWLLVLKTGKLTLELTGYVC